MVLQVSCNTRYQFEHTYTVYLSRKANKAHIKYEYKMSKNVTYSSHIQIKTYLSF